MMDYLEHRDVIGPTNLHSMQLIAQIQRAHRLPLTSADRRSEDVRVRAVVVAELRFRDIERHDRDLFEARPEAKSYDIAGALQWRRFLL
jgi:hypothetical protein